MRLKAVVTITLLVGCSRRLSAPEASEREVSGRPAPGPVTTSITMEPLAKLSARELVVLEDLTKGVDCPPPGGGCDNCKPLHEILGERRAVLDGARDAPGTRRLLNSIPRTLNCPAPGGGCDNCVPALELFRANFDFARVERKGRMNEQAQSQSKPIPPPPPRAPAPPP